MPKIFTFCVEKQKIKKKVESRMDFGLLNLKKIRDTSMMSLISYPNL